MYYEQKNIHISRIKIENRKFRISTQEDIDLLVKSIERIGLINSLVILPQNDEFIILCGFKRLEAALALGWTKIRASILPPHTPKISCVRLCISDNSFQRQLNLIEISKALALLKESFGSDKAVVEEAALLGLPADIKYLKKIEPLFQMPEPVQKGILSNSISLSTAWELSRMPTTEAIAFAEIFSALNCSLNKQREIITLVKEISICENKSVICLLMEDRIANIVYKDNLDKNIKTSRLRSDLRRRRYPRITEAEKVFFTQIEKLRLNGKFRLIPPQDFEGDTYRLTLDFKNLQDLIQHKEKLDEIIINPEFKKILTRY
jgi:ParB family transcriptional regulator, chromosome partitioning protein